MDYLVGLSPLVKLTLTLLTIVALIRVRLPMFAALTFGAVLLAILFPMTPAETGQAFLAGIFSRDTFVLVPVIVGILVFSGALNATQQITRIIESFHGIVGASRLTLMTFPALIGLLPMPGGAIFSAPMVEASTGNSRVSAEQRTLANYWFRHIWEFWFPLYPGVIFALALSELPPERFILMQLPLTGWALVIGWVLILRNIRLEGDRTRNWTRKHLSRFLAELTPIIIVLASVALLSPVSKPLGRILALDPSWLRVLPILIGLAGGLLWLCRSRGLRGRTIFSLFAKRSVFDLAALVVGLMIFKSTLDQSGAVGALRDQFAASGVPLPVVIALIPFAAGVLVGIAVGFVGTSFPVVIALLAGIPEESHAAYYALAFTMGYVGMMLSPLHICLLVTNRFFRSSLVWVYLTLIPLGLSTGAVGILLFLLYRLL